MSAVEEHTCNYDCDHGVVKDEPADDCGTPPWICANCTRPLLEAEEGLCADCQARGAAYAEKVEAKRERLEERAEKARGEAQARRQQADRMADVIPMGQPILVGHHSEKRDRNYREKIRNNFVKSLEAQKKAEYLERRAENVGSSGISSEDPLAVVQLKEKLAELERSQDLMKRVNAAFKKGGWEQVGKLPDRELTPESITKLAKDMALCPWHGAPFPGYALTNNNANIRRVRDRIEVLRKEAQRPEAEPIQGKGFTIEEDKDDQRILFKFDSKPSAGVCQLMRQHGFKWSPTRSAWVRQLNVNGRSTAQYLAEVLNRKDGAL